MTLIDAAADLFLGYRCPGCDRPGRSLCLACRAALAAGHVRFVGRDPSPPHLPLTVAGGDYVGVVPRLVSAFKDEALTGLSGALADRLARAVAHLLAALGRPGDRYHLVPIPSTAGAVRRRGMDHTAVLARRVSRQLRQECGLVLPVRSLLCMRGRVVDQVGLDAAERWANKMDHVVVRRCGPAGSVPVLLDDVTTTGASLAAGARALELAGTPVLGAVVVAATIRRYLPRAKRSGPDGSPSHAAGVA
ncbi:ComF family protein [Granulicoccus sp. GXG6511]|uniref:ComF family protein n=1 Tax=Granulicoccus sp. GXG6511 TaxID=3381351 RepID=UPI003D7C706B